MKLLSVAIPCYNSENYMSRAIETLLVAGKYIEIIIVDDGSVDRTGDIALEYEKMYPDIVKVIRQENKGHGGAINSAIDIATGTYFRVVDSDDWVDEEALKKFIRELRKFEDMQIYPDLIVTNFVYEKVDKKNKKVMSFKNIKTNTVIKWNDMKGFRAGQYILMHNSTYKLNVIKNCELRLPEHTFYVDNIFVYKPLFNVKSIYYLNLDLYRYFIGREDQSINEKVMCSRIEQQLFVNKKMIDIYMEAKQKNKLNNKQKNKYTILYLSTITLVSSVLLNKIGTKEAMDKKEELWKYIEDTDKLLYKNMKKNILGKISTMDSKLGIKFSLYGYKIFRKIYGFN